jgi:hypothetical protein
MNFPLPSLERESLADQKAFAHFDHGEFRAGNLSVLEKDCGH